MKISTTSQQEFGKLKARFELLLEHLKLKVVTCYRWNCTLPRDKEDRLFGPCPDCEERRDRIDAEVSG